MPDLLSDTEEGFADLTFLLESFETDAEGTQHLRATGRRLEQRLAIDVTLGRDWHASNDSPVVVFKGFVTFVSLGKPSDAFVRELDHAYDTKLSPQKMVDSVSFTGLSLEGNPSRLRAEPVKLKLFFEAAQPDDHAELFLEIDASMRRLRIREKDPEYRRATVRALTQR